MQAPADFQQRRVRQFRNGPEVETALVREFFGGAAGYYVDVGANALTKLHLRLPLEDVARILTLEPATPA